MSSLTKSIFSKNFFNLSLNQGVNIFATIIYTPILFQRLGDENFGLIHLAFSIVIILSIIVSYGYNLNGPIKITESDSLEAENFIISNILNLRIVNVVIIFVITFPLIIFFSSENFNKILIFSFIILFNEALNPLFYLQGKNKIFPQAAINFFSKTLYVILLYFFVLNSDDAYLANFFYGLSVSLFMLLFWLNYYKNFGFKKIYFSLRNIKQRIKENFVLFLSSASTHITLNSALIILSLFTNNRELGRFTLAYKIAFLARMIPVFFIQSSLQKASDLYRNSNSEFDKYISKYFNRGLLCTFLLAFLMVFFSDFIIRIFANENIKYSSHILSMLSFIPFFAMFNFKNIICILVNDHKNLLNKATFFTLIFMLLSSSVLSYYFLGYGLAIALLLTEIFSFIMHSILLKNAT
tara:strand:- start:30418 stop:31647 length:1230 start_codon:yes stop_codon:yes gene_type:complete